MPVDDYIRALRIDWTVLAPKIAKQINALLFIWIVPVFWQFSERRKQESVETAFLSKAVGEAYAALKKYISGKLPNMKIRTNRTYIVTDSLEVR